MRRGPGVPTFAEAARRVVEQKRGGWRDKYHAHNWRRLLVDDWATYLDGERQVEDASRC